MKKLFVVATLISIILFSSCSGKPAEKDKEFTPPAVIISFDFSRVSGYATNQFAVWIEDESGTLIKTLYATKFTVEGGYKKRADSISKWVELSALSEKNEPDAITGATPKSGALRYVWDLTNESGKPVEPGSYKYFVEGTLRWSNSALFSGTIDISGGGAESIATAEYFFSNSENGEALNESSSEIDMIKAVKAEFVSE